MHIFYCINITIQKTVMKSTFYLFATVAGLCFLPPFTAQGVALNEKQPLDPGPRNRSGARSFLNPITVDAQAGMLTITFLYEPGEVAVLLQDVATGCIVDEQSIKPDVHEQMVFDLPDGTYTLTIAKMNGEMILQENVVIP